MALELSVKERKILSELDFNARQPLSVIARKVGLSKTVVNYQINRLVESKVINGFYSVIDNSKLDYFSFRIYLKLMDCPPSKEREIISFLLAKKEVSIVVKTDSVFDLGIVVWVKSVYDFENFWLNFKEQFNESILEQRISLLTKVFHFDRAYLLGKKTSEGRVDIVGSSNPVVVDSLDFRILEFLSENARISIAELSENLKTAPKTIAFRIKKLEEKRIILTYKAKLNLEMLGLDYFKVDMKLKNLSQVKELFGFARTHPNIIYVDQTIAGSDFEFDVEIDGRQKLTELLSVLKEKFKTIRSVEYFVFKDYLKLAYLPKE